MCYYTCNKQCAQEADIAREIGLGAHTGATHTPLCIQIRVIRRTYTNVRRTQMRAYLMSTEEHTRKMSFTEEKTTKGASRLPNSVT